MRAENCCVYTGMDSLLHPPDDDLDVDIVDHEDDPCQCGATASYYESWGALMRWTCVSCGEVSERWADES